MARLSGKLFLTVFITVVLFFTARAFAASTAPTLEVIVTQCSDGADNDSDGKIDYPTDPGCSSFSDNDETDPAPPPPPPPSGGGGGGGGYTPPQTVVNFAGRAYPKNTVTLLKDAQVVATTVAGGDANFQISLSGLSGGNYVFSIYGEDSKGIRSALSTFSVSVTAGATTNLSGIFISPSIAADKSEVRRGDTLKIFGQSSPQADIVISVSSEEEFFAKTVTDKDGIYLYNFDTSFLSMGNHNAKSKASIGNLETSSFSRVIGFIVGTKNVLAELPKKVGKGDLNNDKRINIVDFSIIAYWYKRPSPPASADLNGDGKVDLIDFSVMAFNFTG